MDEMQIPQRMPQGSENTYFRIISQIMPYIENTVDSLNPSLLLTDQEIDALTNNIINESNILMGLPSSISPDEIFGVVKTLFLMDMENMAAMDMTDDAVPAIAPYGSGPDPRFGFFPPFFFPPFFFPGPICRGCLPPRRPQRPPMRPPQRPPQRPPMRPR